MAGILVLAAGASAEISLGSTHDSTHLALDPGDYGVYSVSFFNMGDDPLDVEFEVEYPSDLRIEVVPDDLELGSSVSGSPDSAGPWLILDGGRRYVKTYPVKVYIKIPDKISRNLYTVKLIAKAKVAEESDSGGVRQSLVQVREIKLTASVPGRTTTNTPSGVVHIDASNGDSISDDAEKSFSQGQQSGSSSSSGSGGQSGYEQPTSSSSGSNTPAAKWEPEAVNFTRTNSFGIEKDEEGNTNIDLPTGKVSLSQSQTDAAVDIGLVTLVISLASLVVRVLK